MRDLGECIQSLLEIMVLEVDTYLPLKASFSHGKATPIINSHKKEF